LRKAGGYPRAQSRIAQHATTFALVCRSLTPRKGRGDRDLVRFLFALAAGMCWGLYILIGAALGRHTTEGMVWLWVWPSRHWWLCQAALIGLIVLRESLLWSQWIAVLCVVAASAGATRGARPDA
jgi:threonine/homoserine efflux transporter RhtA